MFYCVCVENNKIISLLSYKPNVPKSVTVYEITQKDYDDICNGDSFFNLETLKVEKKEINIPKENQKKYNFLKSTDWKVMRHLREKTLNLPTTLTEEEFLDLEKQRQKTAKEII